MANRKVTNSGASPAVTLTDLLQQLSTFIEQPRNITAPPQFVYRSSAPHNYNAHSQPRKNDREPTIPKETRRKPRWKKKKDDEDNNSLASISSKSSVGSSPYKSTLVFTNKNYNLSKVCNETDGQQASTSKNVNSSSHRNVQTEPFTFSIKHAKCVKTGLYIRKRFDKQPYINLKSFVSENSSVKVFESETFKVPPDLIPKESTEQLNKTQRRKYPKGKSKRERKRLQKEKEAAKFSEYISEQEVQDGLSKGSFLEGFIRVNPKNCRDSYVSNEDTSLVDYLVQSVTDRNRALDGDKVVLEIKPKEEWTADYKTAKVVYITEKIHTRMAIGTLKPAETENIEFALFVPRDKRFPIMQIPQIYWPNGFKEKAKEFDNILFVAKLVEWIDPSNAKGIITEKLGQSANLQVETTSILKECNLDTTPFNENQIQCLPDVKNIAEKEFEYRTDLRKKCIFTIDPATARDLDDAVSVEVLPNGNYEVGVHIADASFFLEEGTELDKVVSKKATTIYLVDNVYHMLPQELCIGCSLLPGEDKLSFSVILEMTPKAEVVNTKFSRSIINSCAKLAYEHAQMVIENPDKDFSKEDFPPVCNGFDTKDVIRTINILQSLAVILRDNRYKNGALRLDNVKLSFSLSPGTSEPLEYSVCEQKESHKMIEEFMLLANISVAGRIYEEFPEMAFLRCHDPPKQSLLVQLQNRLIIYGINLNTSSAGAIASSLKKYITDDHAGCIRAVALYHLTSRAMTRAKYFCAAMAESESAFKHYALSVPIYTHFTSPIRRYADIMVHRLLAASLNYQEKPNWDINHIEAIAKNCNEQKYQAKKAGEASIDLYLAHYVEQHSPFIQDCVVVDVKERKFDAIVLNTGTNVRIYQQSCPRGTRWLYAANKLTIIFPRRKLSEKDTSIIVELFSVVKVSLKRKDSYHLEGTLVRPAEAAGVYKRRERRRNKNRPVIPVE